LLWSGRFGIVDEYQHYWSCKHHVTNIRNCMA
jgi:hypothetical protein